MNTREGEGGRNEGGGKDEEERGGGREGEMFLFQKIKSRFQIPSFISHFRSPKVKPVEEGGFVFLYKTEKKIFF